MQEVKMGQHRRKIDRIQEIIANVPLMVRDSVSEMYAFEHLRGGNRHSLILAVEIVQKNA